MHDGVRSMPEHRNYLLDRLVDSPTPSPICRDLRLWWPAQRGCSAEHGCQTALICNNQGVSVMRAAVGDRLVVMSHHVGERQRSGVIQAILGEDGAPPYRIRWDDGHADLYVPGSDAVVEHLPALPPQN